ncbi:kinesin motor domain-containing protein, partial [Chytriomyces cf. hyalinus JEL632]
TKESIFESEVAPLVSAFIEGFNTTLFAYGQTGSGKTFTMGTAVTDPTPRRSATPSKPKETRGMIPRAVHAIFNKLETLRASEPLTTHNETLKSYSVSVSFLELHNEEWVDLLKESKPANTAKKPPTPSAFKTKASLAEEVSIREDKEGRIAIHGATTVIVESAEAAIRLLSKGSKLRSTAATSMNESSSRSHAIFSLSLTSTQMTSSRPNTGLVITSKFHFVDLAGSERLKRTQNTGDRKTEGICINQGLLVLGRVINCLSESKPNNPDAVVPYRDSKLTRFLQDSLGGNSKTVMLACVSSLESDLSESINTLRYASRARGIQNKSRI